MPFKILDLFCGAGGTTYGFKLAGKQLNISVHVTGIDSKPQPRYLQSGGDIFIQRNALIHDLAFLRSFDFIWASPPCQCYVSTAHHDQHADLIAPTLYLLMEADVPFVIENVPSAPFATNFITLCGTMFPPLRVIRHRRFASHPDLYINQPEHIPKNDHPRVYSFARNRPGFEELNEWDNFVTVAGNNASLGAMSEAMGIWWMTRPEIVQSVPPRYSKYILKEVIKCISHANHSRPAVSL